MSLPTLNKLLSPPNRVTRDIILRPGCAGAPGVGGSRVVEAVTCVVRPGPGCRGRARRVQQVSLCIRCHQYLHCDPPPPSQASVTQVRSLLPSAERKNSHRTALTCVIALNFNQKTMNKYSLIFQFRKVLITLTNIVFFLFKGI